MRSCSLPVLVHETTEQVASRDSVRLTLAGKRQSHGWIRRLQPKRPVRTMTVVVVDIDPEHTLQVPSPDDQQPVKALGAGRLDPSGGSSPAFVGGGQCLLAQLPGAIQVAVGSALPPRPRCT
jgi:hypothetical protein